MLRGGRAAAIGLVALAVCAGPALAQKHGGTLKMGLASTPPSGSIHEEATINTIAPYMPVFNNLVIYDQLVPRNSIESIVPDLATEWRWSEDRKNLTFTLRQGVKWHDGQPFTAKDVKCTWDMVIGQSSEPMRKNPRKPWYDNLEKVSVNGDHEVTFHLGRGQPSLLAMLASGGSPVYPCHVSARDMRLKPIGTGPFKFAELRQNQIVRLVKNEDYWKEGLPYLDAIEVLIMSDRSTRVLSLVSDEIQMSSPGDMTVPLVKQIATQAPEVQCHIGSTVLNTNMMLNRTKPPFDNEKLRQAVMLTLDRKAFVDILTDGKALRGGSMLARPAGVWGLPTEMLDAIPGQAGDVEQNREKARAIMRELGYGPDKHLNVQVSARNVASFRDPAVILIDHLKEIYIDATLETIEVALWYVRLAKRDYAIALNLTGNVIDDPDAVLFENFSCDSERNYTGYCNPALEKQFVAQSMETDFEKRREMVWDIDRQLTADGARSVLFHNISATCHQPSVKNYNDVVNGMYNNWRMEYLWLDW